jgi:hypothetical protein
MDQSPTDINHQTKPRRVGLPDLIRRNDEVELLHQVVAIAATEPRHLNGAVVQTALELFATLADFVSYLLQMC